MMVVFETMSSIVSISNPENNARIYSESSNKMPTINCELSKLWEFWTSDEMVKIDLQLKFMPNSLTKKQSGNQVTKNVQS